MASTFSPSLKIELIGDGDQSGIWGQTTNNNLGTLLEQAITGVVTITMTDTNYTLTSFNGVADEARNAVIVATGTNSQQRNIIAPLVEKIYTIKNSTTGGFAVQIIGASGTGVVIPNGVTASVYCDGTNFYPLQVNSLGNETVNGNLSVTGTTTLTGALTASSGSFAGVLTAPTAAPGTSTTQVATTAFVQNVAGTLGTMSQQNANNVNITGGAINGTTVGASTASTVRGTTITATTQFSGPGTGLTGTASSLSIGGNAATATSPASGGSFITSSNIGSQSVNFANSASFATNATNATNATTATNWGSYGGVPGAGTSFGNANTIGRSDASGYTYFSYINSSTSNSENPSVSQVIVTNGGDNFYRKASIAHLTASLSGTAPINISGNAGTATTATNSSQFQGKTKLGLGITGETWVNVTGSRSFGATYTNTTGYPIMVSASTNFGGPTAVIQSYVNGVLITWWQWQFNGAGSIGGAVLIVPPGATYQLNGNFGLQNWQELY